MKQIIALALAALVVGCATEGSGLVPGQSTAADVEARMGPAAEKRRRPAGKRSTTTRGCLGGMPPTRRASRPTGGWWRSSSA